jgi:hypothetical protein
MASVRRSAEEESADELAELVSRLRRIPYDARAFTVPEREVSAEYGLSPRVLASLVEEGLPFTTTGGERRYDHGDLHYVGLRLGTATSYLTAIRLWTRLLRRVATHAETRVVIRYVPIIPADRGGCRASLNLPDGRRVEAELWPHQPAGEATVELRPTWPSVPPHLATQLEELDAFDFFQLPKGVRLDWQFARRVGLIDCGTAAPMIVADCVAAGFDARVVEGILVSLPFSILHDWAEVRVDGVWVPFDPILINVMRRFGGLDAAEWPLSRPFSIVAGFPGEWPIVTDGGTPVHVTFVTSLVGE